MNKAQLVDAIATREGVTKTVAKKCIDAMIRIVADTLKEGDKLTLTGLGTFSVSRAKGRTGRNPITGSPIKIAPKNSIKFRVGTELSAYIQ